MSTAVRESEKSAVDTSAPERVALSDLDINDIDVPPCDPLFAQQWSCLPIECTLSTDDAKDGAKHTCKFIVPRQSYLFLHLESVTQTLAPHAADAGNVWFTWAPEGSVGTERFVPLHLPMSVIFDYLYQTDPGAAAKLIPLQLKVHFKKPAVPDKEAADYKEKQAIWDAFVSTICIKDKEAAYISFEQLLKQSLALRFGCPFDKKDFGKSFYSLYTHASNNSANEFWTLRYQLLSVGERIGTSKFAGIVIHAGGKSRLVRAKPSGEKLGPFLKQHVQQFRTLTINQCHSTKELANVLIQGLRPVYGTPLDSLVDMFSSVDLCLHIVVLDA